MSDKRKIGEDGVSVEEAEDIDPDEQAKPTRKTSHQPRSFPYMKNQAEFIRKREQGR